MGLQPSSAPTPLLPEGQPPPARRRMLRSERRGLAIAAVSSVLVLGGLAVGAILAPGSKEVQKAFFAPHHLKGAILGTHTTTAVTGSVVAAFFSVTVRMFLLAEVLVLAFAMFLAVVRSLAGPVSFPFRVLAIAYIDFFRGIRTVGAPVNQQRAPVVGEPRFDDADVMVPEYAIDFTGAPPLL